jgi:uncharacterized tellurite resistance protein B-like protein
MATKQATKLGRDVFIALAGIGWADAKLSQDEADAIVRIAVEEGLELDEIEEIENATKNECGVGNVNIHDMKKFDRLFIYALATWIVRMDGHVSPSEITALNRLAETLKIPEKPREHADHIAIEVAKASGGGDPTAFKLSSLRKTLREKLEEAKQIREAEEDG